MAAAAASAVLGAGAASVPPPSAPLASVANGPLKPDVAAAAAAGAAAVSGLGLVVGEGGGASCVLRCSNMLTPAELADAEERTSLKEDVEQELVQYGIIHAMKIPTSDNQDCNVYVRFGSAAAATAALTALRGRKFDGREVEVGLCHVERFDALVDGA
jgi:hypothetical protein